MAADHLEYGKWAEQQAASFLERNGYAILEKNWRFDHAEVDLIASLENWVIAVEVKARKDDGFMAPEQAVDERKVNLLKKAMNKYIDQVSGIPQIRFDIVAITGNSQQYRIKHITHAFE